MMIATDEKRARLAILLNYALGRALFAQLMQQTGSAQVILSVG